MTHTQNLSPSNATGNQGWANARPVSSMKAEEGVTKFRYDWYVQYKCKTEEMKILRILQIVIYIAIKC